MNGRGRRVKVKTKTNLGNIRRNLKSKKHNEQLEGKIRELI